MLKFTTIIEKFDKKGEKSGWTYVHIPKSKANQIKEGVRKSYRVKGQIDRFAIKGVSLIPMGDGDFIIPLNATMRKGINKKVGDKVSLALTEDNEVKKISEELMACLHDDPEALAKFNSLPSSHQRYYSNWIETAKSAETRAKRITKTIIGITSGLSFGETMKLDI